MFHGPERFVEHCQKKECWKTKELCLKKREARSENTKSCTRTTFSAAGYVTAQKDKAEERENVNWEAKEEECKHGKREFEGEQEEWLWFANAPVMNLTLI